MEMWRNSAGFCLVPVFVYDAQMDFSGRSTGARKRPDCHVLRTSLDTFFVQY